MRTMQMFAFLSVIVLHPMARVIAQPEKVGVVVQIIRDNAGNNGISLDTVYASIDRVNAAFLPINIEFLIVAIGTSTVLAMQRWPKKILRTYCLNTTSMLQVR